MKDLFVITPGFRTINTTYANGTGSTTLVNSASHHIYRASSGYVGKRSKSHPNYPNAYHINVQEYSLENTSYDAVYANGQHDVAYGPYLSRTNYGCEIIPGYPGGNSLDIRALDALTDNTRGDLDLSVDFAEWHQTRDMFRLSKQVEDLTRVFARKFGVLKVAGNAYLQYIYGVKPLISDIFGAADESMRIVLNKIERYKSRATDYYVPKQVGMWTPNGYQYYDVVGGKVKVSISYGIMLNTAMSDLSRWTSLNPVSIAWELLPYSFVADWFLNVGGYLRNLETSLLYSNRFVSGYRTALTAADVSVEKYAKMTGNPVGSYLFRGTYRNRDISRTVLNSYPAPSLPSFRARLGSSRLLNAASLLTTLLSSGGHPSKSAHSLAKERRVQSDVNRQRKRALPNTNVSYWPPGYIHM